LETTLQSIDMYFASLLLVDCKSRKHNSWGEQASVSVLP
jgi:uncharacterized membrane protein YebE (DUF533 family)